MNVLYAWDAHAGKVVEKTKAARPRTPQSPTRSYSPKLTALELISRERDLLKKRYAANQAKQRTVKGLRSEQQQRRAVRSLSQAKRGSTPRTPRSTPQTDTTSRILEEERAIEALKAQLLQCEEKHSEELTSTRAFLEKLREENSAMRAELQRATQTQSQTDLTPLSRASSVPAAAVRIDATVPLLSPMALRSPSSERAASHPAVSPAHSAVSPTRSLLSPTRSARHTSPAVSPHYSPLRSAPGSPASQATSPIASPRIDTEEALRTLLAPGFAGRVTEGLPIDSKRGVPAAKGVASAAEVKEATAVCKALSAAYAVGLGGSAFFGGAAPSEVDRENFKLLWPHVAVCLQGMGMETKHTPQTKTDIMPSTLLFDDFEAMQTPLTVDTLLETPRLASQVVAERQQKLEAATARTTTTTTTPSLTLDSFKDAEAPLQVPGLLESSPRLASEVVAERASRRRAEALLALLAVEDASRQAAEEAEHLARGAALSTFAQQHTILCTARYLTELAADETQGRHDAETSQQRQRKLLYDDAEAGLRATRPRNSPTPTGSPSAVPSQTPPMVASDAPSKETIIGIEETVTRLPLRPALSPKGSPNASPSNKSVRHSPTVHIHLPNQELATLPTDAAVFAQHEVFRTHTIVVQETTEETFVSNSEGFRFEVKEPITREGGVEPIVTEDLQATDAPDVASPREGTPMPQAPPTPTPRPATTSVPLSEACLKEMAEVVSSERESRHVVRSFAAAEGDVDVLQKVADEAFAVLGVALLLVSSGEDKIAIGCRSKGKEGGGIDAGAWLQTLSNHDDVCAWAVGTPSASTASAVAYHDKDSIPPRTVESMASKVLYLARQYIASM